MVVASDEFAGLTDQVARDLLFADARRVVVPHPIGGTPEAELERRATAVVDGALEALG